MHNRYFQKIAYLPLAALVMGWSMFANVARGSPGGGVANSQAAYQEEASPPEYSNGQSPESAGWDFQAEATGLLNEIRAFSGQLNRHADTLNSLAQRNSQREGQALELNQMRERINAIGSRLSRLQDIKHVTASWQQMAIERIHPLAADVAESAEAAIAHINENGNHLFAPSYRETVSSAADQADELQSAVSNFMAYGNSLENVDRLRSVLEAS